MNVIDLEKHLPQLKNFFAAQPEVVLAYLYGSYATKRVWAESDLDIAVLFDDGIAAYDQFQLALRYGVDLSDLVGGVEIDVRELNPAPVEFRMQVIEPGRCLYARGEEERIQFEAQTILEYLDFKPVLDEYYHHLARRIKEKRFSAQLPKYMAEVRAIKEQEDSF